MCLTFCIYGNITHGVIAKEDTAKGGKSAHEIRFDGDRCLDPINIGRARHLYRANSACRHDGGGCVCMVWARKGVLCTYRPMLVNGCEEVEVSA
jgi:hypothetical protein